MGLDFRIGVSGFMRVSQVWSLEHRIIGFQAFSGSISSRASDCIVLDDFFGLIAPFK